MNNLPKPKWLENGALVLCLPLPAQGISPNARRGESRGAAIMKSRAVKAHRYQAFLAAKNAIVAAGARIMPEFAGYSLAFFFKTAAYRDDDNADGSCKAYRDGIADAVGMNDRHLRKLKLSTLSKDAICPRVEITLYRKAEA
jgi:crossover junction endodeoxyribonuclease RusA